MKKFIKNVAAYLLAGILLWYLFGDTDWAGVGHALKQAHLGWIALATLLILSTFFLRVQRWSYVVRTAKPVSYRALFSATQIGFLGNFVLPGRLGEAIRAMVLGRLANLPFSKCLAFVALDRVLDLAGLLVVMLVTVFAYPHDQDIVLPTDVWEKPIPKEWIVGSAEIVAATALGITAAFVLLYLNQKLALRVSGALCRFFGGMAGTLVGMLPGERCARWGEKLKGIDVPVNQMLQHFAEGLHLFRSGRELGKAVSLSLIMWGCGMLSYVCLIPAFGLSSEMPWYTGFLMMTLLTVFISVPGTPGFVGTFHIGIMAGLFIANPAVDLNTAKAVAIVAHLLNLACVVVIGLYCLHREGLGREALRAPEESEGSGDTTH